MRTLLTLAILAGLTCAGVAWATAGTTATIALTPDTPSAPSSIALTIPGLAIGLPRSIEVLLQRGFAASDKSVSTLCTSTQANNSACPPASQVGTGSAVIVLAGPPTTVPVALFLGAPAQTGDIATLLLTITYDGSHFTLSGRLFTPPQGGLELLIGSLPPVPLTLDSLSFTAHASQTTTRPATRTSGKTGTRRVTRPRKSIASLITNPSSCAGQWTGTVTLVYASGTKSAPLAAPCTP